MSGLGTGKRLLLALLALVIDFLIFYWMYTTNFTFLYDTVAILPGDDLFVHWITALTFFFSLFLLLSAYGLLHSVLYIIYPDFRAGVPLTTVYISWLAEFVPFCLNIAFFVLFYFQIGDMGFWGAVNFLIFVGQWFVWDGLGLFFAVEDIF